MANRRSSPASDSEVEADLSTQEVESLELALETLCLAGENSWPKIILSRSSFVSKLAANHDTKSLLGINESSACEMFLGHACAAGDPQALFVFDNEYLSRIPGMLSHMKLSPSTLDEVVQQVRMKLLVGEASSPPKIGSYANRGKLAGMVQVVATRTAISLLRKIKPQAPDDTLISLASPDNDLGLHYIKQQYRSEFKNCFEEAVRGLSNRDRTLLRLHLLHRVTLDKLAVMYYVHRATIVRWIAKARQELLGKTKELLGKKLQLEASEFDSLMQMVQSNLDLSTSRIFKSMPE